MPKDTKTRYQGVYARHKTGCGVERDRRCSCSPSYWGSAWDRVARKNRSTAFMATPAAANNARDDLKRSLREGILPASESMLLSAAVESFLLMAREGVALNKHGRQYKKEALRDLDGALNGHVVLAVGHLRTGDVRRRHVQELVDKVSPRLSGSRVRTIVNSIHSLYRWAQAREVAYHDPAALVQLPAMDAEPRDRVATVAEFRALLGVLDPADALPYAIAGYATARNAEIRHALVEDVDLGVEVIYLGADERGRKSRAAQRPVPIAKPLMPMLRAAVLGRDPEEPLCPPRKNSRSRLLCMGALQKRVDKVWEGLGLARITLHECRHTCSTWLDAAGVRPVVVSRLMGHSLPRRQEGAARITQERYTHVLPDDLELARRQFNAFLVRRKTAGSR